MNRTPPSRARRGFTLIELIVAGAIGGALALATVTVLSQMVRTRAASESRRQAFARADAAAGQIALDLQNVVRDYEPRFQYLQVLNQGDQVAPADELLMLSKSLKPVRGLEGNPEGDLFEVQYRVAAGPENRQWLWRRVDPAFDAAIDAGGVATPLVRGIVSLSVEALDRDTWLEDWDADRDGLPYAVRVTVQAISDNGQRTATSRRVVAVDRVPLLPEDVATEEDRQPPSETAPAADSTQTPTPTTNGGGGSGAGGGGGSGGPRPPGGGGGPGGGGQGGGQGGPGVPGQGGQPAAGGQPGPAAPQPGTGRPGGGGRPGAGRPTGGGGGGGRP